MTPPPAGIAFATGVLLVVCLAYALAIRALGGLATTGLSIGTGVIAGMRAWAGAGIDPPDDPSGIGTARGFPVGPDDPDAGALVSGIGDSSDGGTIHPQLERVRPLRRH